jgi:hypothetical protein
MRFNWLYRHTVSSCPEAWRLQTYVKEAIAPQLTDAVDQEKFDAVMAALERYKDNLLKNKKTFHYPAGGSRHYCIQETFAFLTEYLTAEWLLRPHPIAEPAPRAPLETPEQVVADLGELIQHRQDETVLGEDMEATQ